MNKKAIALSFLLVLILSLLIWIPTCIVLSGYFRQTSQAVDSFNFLSNQINQFQSATKGEIKIADQSITMDKNSMIVVFPGLEVPLTIPDVPVYYEYSELNSIYSEIATAVISPSAWVTQKFGELILEQLNEGVIISSTALITKPKVSECTNKKCICLLADLEKQFSIVGHVAITYKKATCNTIPLNLLKTEKSSPLIIRSSTIEGKDSARDRGIYLEKGTGSIFGMCEESPCLT